MGGDIEERMNERRGRIDEGVWWIKDKNDEYIMIHLQWAQNWEWNKIEGTKVVQAVFFKSNMSVQIRTI